ncbi:alkaline phosphatase family protein [Botrimarina hoheduenensis]|uniref:Type I phosphodiesterase / nucleotide pyrophosphatase n=1 Tax=Botrimarina hoheduenensis TaxID=2528000 RepID=A0A5C5VZE6_9BACT|nr:nucleotide pyrophosphatase/phosphodiesterase family protein [Botrimarina hoheduenensis]TWT42842.1 Type I phosphodiesterase / nucleotide pyrophosphatase [Botrimarina hoheduenensis]
MNDRVVLLSIPGLRESDLVVMPCLRGLTSAGDLAPLSASAPGVTCAVQANMTTGELAGVHGVIGNGFYWREEQRVEMWTAGNDKVMAPQLWDRLHEHDPTLTSAAWFPLLIKGAGADYICTPAPIHHPDGAESLWCYTRPERLYGELVNNLGHFPLHRFWGPLAGVEGTAWIITSAIEIARREAPHLLYIYLPHLDYRAQKHGPDSPEAVEACRELDAQLGRLIGSLGELPDYRGDAALWLVASEYAITAVDRVVYPNRLLRQAGLLDVTRDADGRELIDFAESRAWVLADHQTAHAFVRDHDPAVIGRVADVLAKAPGVAEVWDADIQQRHGLWYEGRSADLLAVSDAEAWFAYYWWQEDDLAPKFARTVDIHRKPGYDPAEMFLDPAAHAAGIGGTPLDASRVRGSHGAPVRSPSQRGVLLSSARGVLVEQPMADIDVCETVLRQFGV